MRFWDSSALLPLVVGEASSSQILDVLRQDPVQVLWWGSPVECTSALWRRHREGALPLDQLQQAASDLRTLVEAATEISPHRALRARAQHLVAAQALRAADALQLAAALVWAEATGSAAMVCLDERLRQAAAREGLEVLP